VIPRAFLAFPGFVLAAAAYVIVLAADARGANAGETLQKHAL